MNVNIYINDDLAKQLDIVAIGTNKKRNTLIQEAITMLVKSHKKEKWPDSILDFNGIENITSWEGFEEHRRELKEPNADIFKDN
jgi:predicted transcriptional regulator